MKGRFIGDNIRLIDGIINYTAKENLPGLLLFLDFEKAFDTVEWNCIQKTLGMFGFGSSSGSTCAITISKAVSWIMAGKGELHKAVLFRLTSLFSVWKFLPKTSGKQLFFLMYQKNLSYRLYKSWKILERYRAFKPDIFLLQSISGLKLNNKKTEALWIGVYKESDVILCPEKKT